MNTSFEDKIYWENYYQKVIESIGNSEPSPFAEYLVNHNYIENKNIIELGCGNGRDALFFAKNKALVTAIDQCSTTTELLNDFNAIVSYPSDFTRLTEIESENKFDIVYSRFTMHSIDEEGEDRTLKWAFNNLNSNGLFCIEVRTIKDTLFGKGIDKGNNIWFYNNHHRRFVDSISFKEKLEKIGFKFILFDENNGFAKYKNENPIVLRLIAEKK